MLRYSLLFLFIITFLLSFKNAQGIIFPVAILVMILKDRIKYFFTRFSAGISFIGLGICMGLLTEFFAIISNSNLPNNQKILLHPDPYIDLLIGLFYYSFIIITWFLILRRYSFNKKTVFILSGLIGVLTEQSGSIFLEIFLNPISGIPMAIIIACIYAIFPTIAYTISEEQFPKTRIYPKYHHYILAMFMLFIQWAIFGNVVYRFFLVVFPK